MEKKEIYQQVTYLLVKFLKLMKLILNQSHGSMKN
ncbi:Uncharacterised protein [Yersinia aldovae]|nr:Uncharacterised protein [Yersinia aldovae]